MLVSRLPLPLRAQPKPQRPSTAGASIPASSGSAAAAASAGTFNSDASEPAAAMPVGSAAAAAAVLRPSSGRSKPSADSAVAGAVASGSKQGAESKDADSVADLHSMPLARVGSVHENKRAHPHLRQGSIPVHVAHQRKPTKLASVEVGFHLRFVCRFASLRTDRCGLAVLIVCRSRRGCWPNSRAQAPSRHPPGRALSCRCQLLFLLVCSPVSSPGTKRGKRKAGKSIALPPAPAGENCVPCALCRY